MRLKRSLVKVVDNQWDQNLAPDIKILNQSKKKKKIQTQRKNTFR